MAAEVVDVETVEMTKILGEKPAETTAMEVPNMKTI